MPPCKQFAGRGARVSVDDGAITTRLSSGRLGGCAARDPPSACSRLTAPTVVATTILFTANSFPPAPHLPAKRRTGTDAAPPRSGVGAAFRGLILSLNRGRD